MEPILKATEARASAAMATPLPPSRLRRAINGLDDGLMLISAMVLFVMMLLVVTDVGRRYFFNAPLAWAYEVISIYLTPAVFFLAISHTLKSHAHVAVDILHNWASPRTRHALLAVGAVLACPVFAFGAWHAANVTWHDWQSQAVSSTGLPVPTWTTTNFLPLGFGMLALRLLLDAVDHLRSVATGRTVLALPPISGTEELTP